MPPRSHLALQRRFEDPELRQTLRERLGEHNVSASPAFARTVVSDLELPFPLEIYLLEGEELRAGIAGQVRRAWLDIDFFWVTDALRGGGVGRALLRDLEGRARAVGARYARLTTFDFQARPFYERQGYSVYGILEDYPPGCTLFYLRKTLR
ncbi:GNAT superfamily N-acetyltransferase [Deinobacterium chartae]|uniref:GNAT superfamily N-acetyltransferase n=1 Tax=Deinobacterium chartae TaxID=521158 RepID=A0A841I0T3_9DEIO|nr:GNAT family N-acetyltransferase [Deinobacterium chartae]MBB6098019.1 GNAT superfamily N-acetyltransferase [Deinobacterium chartae]